MFTAGLLSRLDAILDRPLPEIIAQLPLSSRSARRSPAGRRGPLASSTPSATRTAVTCARSPARSSAQAVFMAWYESVRWADDIMRRL